MKILYKFNMQLFHIIQLLLVYIVLSAQNKPKLRTLAYV